MPHAAPTPCRYPGCPALLSVPGHCEAHKQQTQRKQDERRGSAASRGYGHRWRKARDAFLRAHPLCAECERRGRVTAANEVDHIRPHKGDQAMFWDSSNWQSLCKTCHSTKTAAEDGGYGRGVGDANLRVAADRDRSPHHLRTSTKFRFSV
jgi:5-methylcytosine-specific restriction protein A